MNQPTRFFCRCGRLLTAPPSATMVDCPTCRTQNSIPGRDSLPAAPVRSTATAVLSPQEGTRIGRYRLERSIGRGGMGAVFAAVDEVAGQRVAVKLLHAAFQARPDFVSRFEREARAAQRLEHPNIVRVLDFGVEDGVPFIAMELLEGLDLLEVTRERTLDEGRALTWLTQAASGLAAAAKQGIIHRDIKPTNLVLVGDQLKIADFGLAKALDSDSHLTVTGEVLGTPSYMSPEQGRGALVDHRSDLYSLGATFYHLLAGTPVFEADTPVAVIMKHLHEEPTPLRTHAPDVSEFLEQVVHRLLQKNPGDRYQDYAALLEDLKRVGQGRAPQKGAAPPKRRVREGGTTYILPSAQQTELLLKPAGTVRRLFAGLLDLAMVELLVFGVFWISSGFEGQHILADPEQWQRNHQNLLYAALTLVAALLYFTAADASGGRSFGKARARLRVCGEDGRNLGGLRALVRTILFLPGFLFLAPTLRWAALLCAQAVDPSYGREFDQAWLVGIAYVLGLWVVGRLAGGGRPLHDLVGSAQVYRAESAAKKKRALARRSHSGSPRMALWLSVFPGVGLMFAGRVGLGLFFMVVIPMSLARAEDSPRWPLGLWVASAVLAYSFAAARQRHARKKPQHGLDPNLIRRQES